MENVSIANVQLFSVDVKIIIYAADSPQDEIWEKNSFPIVFNWYLWSLVENFPYYIISSGDNSQRSLDWNNKINW